MPDNPRKRGRADRRRASAFQEHEVNYLSHHYGTTPTNVRRVIARVGNMRNAVISALAQNLKRRKQRAASK